MIIPARDRRQPAKLSRERIKPFPLRGWNTRDPITATDPAFARRALNVVIGDEGCTPRPGYVDHFSQISGAIDSLLVWTAPDATWKMFAATSNGLFDVTRPGSRRAADVDGLHSGQWSSVLLNNEAGAFLCAVNGADPYRVFDGSTWTVDGVTNFDSALLSQVAIHKHRLWFVARQSKSLYYLPDRAIGGTVSEWPVEYLARRNGYILAAASLSNDGGKGPDDRFVVVTTEGELIVYAGSNPDREETWQLVGVYPVPKPLGSKCFTEIGGKLAYLSVDGVLMVPDVLARPEHDKDSGAISSPISPEFGKAHRTALAKQAWQAIEDTQRGLLLVNAPYTRQLGAHNIGRILLEDGDYLLFENGGFIGLQPGLPAEVGLPAVPGREAGIYDVARQMIWNADTGAWSEWIGHDARCWARAGGELFYGTLDGAVRKITGHTDAGAPIEATIVDAFDRFGTAQLKTWHRIKPMITAQAAYKPFAGVNTDWRGPEAPEAPNTLTVSTAWADVDWGSPWRPDMRRIYDWRGVNGRGQAASAVVAIKATAPWTYEGYEISYTVGGSI